MDYEREMQWRAWKAFFYLSCGTLVISTIYFFQNALGYYNFISIQLAVALVVCVISAFLTASLFYVLSYATSGRYSEPVANILTYGFAAGCIALSFFESKWILSMFT
ncbi:hypothetical protein [Sinorhizobium meliloti]|uniref:hypothetical protein n=1 Tax=Rhizobium meliloti TaxID=382 RepID=UPI00028612C8|nr:hypothetical protein [Sinorhizobium meliloti]MDX0437113.1 hypothetical protein [Sinorhizobium medicae]MQW16675.1 hypothetical protein [Sinorhizobium meliloti]RVI70091.1 hypothetical protein CN189_01740 [Sinorhizobium meliloti]CCM68196.1 putative membrane protein [Sinorhizobium meliloti Rm41]